VADARALRQLEDQERIAVLEGDSASLERVWSEDFTVNNPMNRISPDRTAVLDLVRRGALRYSSFDRRIEQLRVLGDLAIVMGAETVQPVAKPPVPPVQRRFTHVWRKEAGNWRLLARHANNIAAP
jgi:ketosteroid isomerase-like protein